MSNHKQLMKGRTMKRDDLTPMDKLKLLNDRFDFNVQLINGDYNIYCNNTDLNQSEVASIGGYSNLEDAVNDLIIQLEGNGYDLTKYFEL